MKCKISSWGCVYHACMTDDCQKEIIKEDDPCIEKRWGKGRCDENKESSNNQTNKTALDGLKKSNKQNE